jgi:predicted MFS family arabinose efflux permease
MNLPLKDQAAAKPSALAAIAEGITYVRNQPLVRTLMGSAFFYHIFDYAMILFIPAFAVQLFQGSAATNGLLLTVNAAGAVIGGLLLAAFSNRAKRVTLWTASAYLTPFLIAGFALSRFLPLSLLLTAGIGVTSITVLSNTSAMIQQNISNDLRGRVLSLYSLLFQVGGPLGSMLLGLLADRVGVTSIVAICAAMALIFAMWAWRFKRRLEGG